MYQRQNFVSISPGHRFLNEQHFTLKIKRFAVLMTGYRFKHVPLLRCSMDSIVRAVMFGSPSLSF